METQLTELLGRLFPETYSETLKEWGLYFPFYQIPKIHLKWFKHEDILLGSYTNPILSSKTVFIRSLKNFKLVINRIEPDGFLEDFIVYESILKPELIPLCLNHHWAQPLMEHLLKK